MTRTNTKPRGALATIGRILEHTGVHIETIRYYERIGLLPVPLRSRGRHRLYDESHRQRHIFIRRSRELGFSQDQIRQLLGFSGGAKLACGDVKALTQQHIASVRRKIRDLRRLERVLSNLSARAVRGTKTRPVRSSTPWPLLPSRLGSTLPPTPNPYRLLDGLASLLGA